MCHFNCVPARSMAGGGGTHDPAAGKSLALAPAALIELIDNSAAVLPDRAATRPGEARSQ
jgi:hypothetical protein